MRIDWLKSLYVNWTSLTVLPELPVARLTVAGLRGKEGQLAVGIERLPGAVFEFGFVVPRIDMAEATRTENLDDGIGLRAVMRTLTGGRSSEWPLLRRIRGSSRSLIREQSILGQQGGQGDTTQAAAELPQKIASRGDVVVDESSIDVNKLIGVQQHSTKLWKAAGLQQCDGGGGFSGIGSPTERQRERSTDLSFG